MKYCIVGAGFSGAIVARHLAGAGHTVVVLDERQHLGGNCHTERDAETGVMVHRYGPHIFHTADERAWKYVGQFGTFRPFVNRVKAVSQGKVYTLPVNLLTINQFFNTTMGPREARAFIAEKADRSITEPRNFEEQALSMIGPELYRAFFLGYTRKQWGLEPTELPASILKRLPLRFNYDDNYFNHPWQGMPENGYTSIIKNILDAPGIEVRLGTRFEAVEEQFSHIFYTGPIDRYFDFRLGRLGYRTLDFERFEDDGDHQGTAVMNYCDEAVPFTRISEHKHFAPWEQDQFLRTVCFREYSRLAGANDTPYYPIRLAQEKHMLDNYIQLARAEPGVSFLGRLGTYRYLDMDVTVTEALAACDRIDDALRAGAAIPAFFVDPG
ncbi:UDP-galactopyranose mutase [Gluconacetobacter azotocaptans]|uniref:UDP-galactopyranose mutase n=1 Tax=Gluconacetobacter azotocaptans TaxID=142834 RepID=A0A7W4JPW6_9PROT|nr:UDP-galactopyranose mutase [Gluconacetobacter azotocaptans]MBB2188717.1 UDP-galactopyranose mutase [Gluconacetobacter azotocaptans]GBQ34947.1 UDP-galactopyranose mutase [Gluconacetobacter azotocaptans DSM 13594]